MKHIKNAGVVFKIVWDISPSYFFLLLFNSLSYSGQILCNVVFPKYLIDGLMAGEPFEVLLFWVGAIALSNLLFAFLSKTTKRLMDVKDRVVRYEVERAFAKKIMSVEYRYLEDPHFLDLKERATFAMMNQGAISNLIANSVNLLNQLITVAGLVVIMLRLSWVLVAALLVTVGIILLIQASFSKYQQQFFKDVLPVNRKYGYYVNLAFEKAAHKDFRLYDMGDMVGDTITSYNREINKWFGGMYRKMGLFMGLFQVVVVLQTTLAYGYVASRTLGGGIGIGDLTMYVTSAINFSSAVIALGTAVVMMLQMLGYLEPFAELMRVPDAAACTGRKKLDKVRSIRFENVSFAYPKTDKKVLDGISFEIREGEKISIVGLNGAGKSTIVKLLCRLYKPDSGRILINDADIFEYEQESYLAAIAAVFQDFKLFNFTIQENITTKPAGVDDEKVERILSEVGIAEKVRSLPKGMQTLFGKEYDEEGVEFSGGQAQKIAIARALYKDASLVILDEPTSALDPIAEAEIYENFNQMVGDKTAIYISHRMSSSVFCDRILVVNGGKIEAYGPHKKLMEDENGLYARLFASQAENYKVS